MSEIHPSRVALVTGASSGIGRALARVLALDDGYAVGLVARRRDRLESLASEIASAGGTACVAVADVTDPAAVRGATEIVQGALGPVDLLVANAGMSTPTDALTPNAEAFEQEVGTNLLGVFYAIEAVVPTMRERGAGHIVTISSLASWRGLPGTAGYSATKAALNKLMEGLRVDWGPVGIRSTNVLPGFVVSEITQRRTHPKPFLMGTDKAAAKIARAIRRGRKTYAFPWPTVWLARLGWLLPDFVIRRIDGHDRR